MAPKFSSYHWQKEGLIYRVPRNHSWIASHGHVPTILDCGTYLRVYFSVRDQHNRSFPVFIDVNPDNPTQILRTSVDRPLLDLGATGHFDDDGVMPCSVVADGDRVYLYYIGWNRGVTVSYRNAIGLAVSDDGGETFTRRYVGPIIDRYKDEPLLAASPFMMKQGDQWHAWYTSGVAWVEINGKNEPTYTIRYARSDNGIDWYRDGHVCVQPRHDLEAFARPSLWYDNGVYRMWYSYRDSHDYRDGAGSYRIGYAESHNGRDFERFDDNTGIDLSASGFDSAMQCYINVVPLAHTTYLFYNGNGFGREGFGYARYVATA